MGATPPAQAGSVVTDPLPALEHAPRLPAAVVPRAEQDGEEAVLRPTLGEAFERGFAYVHKSLRRLGVREADLEDVAHDVFVVVHRHLDRYDPERPLLPWLFGISVRVASDYRRRARHQREVPADPVAEPADPAPTAETLLAEEQRRRLVLSALDTLDADRRAVFVLHDLDEQPVPVVADALGIPLGTAYSRLRLARQDFAAAVKRLRLQRGEPWASGASRRPEGAKT